MVSRPIDGQGMEPGMLAERARQGPMDEGSARTGRRARTERTEQALVF